MRIGIKITGMSKLVANLNRIAAKSKKEDDGAVIVGFSQNYAVHVHERTDLKHREGEAKFLEKAVAANAGQVSRMVAEIRRRKGSLIQGLLVAGMKIQGGAQNKTPVLTGALRASAYTAKEERAEAAASVAFNKSEKIRQGKKK